MYTQLHDASSCIVPHIDAINSFHDHIIELCKIALSVQIPHTNSGVCKAKVIPGWDFLVLQL